MGKVLIVEHERNLQMLIAANLKARGYEVVTVGTGEQALRSLDENQIDLMIVGIWLPDMDENAFIEEVRTRKPDLRILYLRGGRLYDDDGPLIVPEL